MNFSNEIACVDRNGVENVFKYSLNNSEENGNTKWVFKVMPYDLIAKDWFEFAVTIVDSKNGKITIMDNRKMSEYISKGIPDKLIEDASTVLKISISSSSNKPEYKNFDPEWRTTDADKVWERLVFKNLAYYDFERDTYYYTGN
jgi:hypothetical protein